MLRQSPTSKPRSNDEAREAAWGKWGTARPFMDKEFDAAHGWFVAGWNARALASVPVPTDTKELIAAVTKACDLIGNQSGDITGAALDAWVILSNALSSLSPDGDVQEKGPDFDTSPERVKELDGSES